MGAWAAPSMHPHIPCLSYPVRQLIVLLIVTPNQYLCTQSSQVRQTCTIWIAYVHVTVLPLNAPMRDCGMFSLYLRDVNSPGPSGYAFLGHTKHFFNGNNMLQD